MDFAEGERLMTRETVAGERPRCSASALRLTACGGRSERRIEAAPGFERGIGVDRYAVTHNVDRYAAILDLTAVRSHIRCARSLAQGAAAGKGRGRIFGARKIRLTKVLGGRY